MLFSSWLISCVTGLPFGSSLNSSMWQRRLGRTGRSPPSDFLQVLSLSLSLDWVKSAKRKHRQRSLTAGKTEIVVAGRGWARIWGEKIENSSVRTYADVAAMASKHQTPDTGGEDMCVGLNFIAELLAERYLLKEEKKNKCDGNPHRPHLRTKGLTRSLKKVGLTCRARVGKQGPLNVFALAVSVHYRNGRQYTSTIFLWIR